MEPPLGSQPCPLGLVHGQAVRCSARPGRGRPLFAPTNRHAPLILNRQPSREKVTTFGLRQILLQRPTEITRYLMVICAMFPRFDRRRVRFGPTQGQRQRRFARLRRLSLNLAFVGSARHRRGRRFPAASGFGRFPPFAGERKTLTNPLTL